MRKKLSLLMVALVALAAFAIRKAAAEPELYAVADSFTPTDNLQVQATTSVKLTYGADGKWKASASNTLDDNLKFYVVGQNNPKDGELSGTSSSGSGYTTAKKNLPKSGTYYVFEPSKAGTLKVGICLANDKSFYVTDGEGNCMSDKVTLTSKDGSSVSYQTAEGKVEYSVAAKLYGFAEFDVEAGGTYYVFCAGSKLSFYGFYFTEATASEPTKYNVSVATGIENGSVAVDKETAAEGETVTVTCTPDNGYKASSVSVYDVTGASAAEAIVGTTENVYSFTMPAKAVRVSATFEAVSQGGGDEPIVGATYYQKVTTTEDIVDGDYLIVYEAEKVAFNGALESLDAAKNTVSVEIADNVISSSETVDAAIFTFDTTEKTIKSASGFYVGITSYANGLKQSATLTEKFNHNSFAIDQSGNVIITKTYEGGDMILNYNANANDKRFRYYKGGSQKPIQLYKKVSGAAPVDNRTATTIVLGEYATTAEVGAEYALPTATVTGADGAPIENAAVTWTSSDAEVAEIATTYAGLNLKKAGKATITATYEGDNTYKGSTASFELTVTGAPYTSIAAMLADITATKTTATYKFENLLVTYVNGSNTYVHDGTNGFLFYGSNLGLVAGQKITGTVTGQLYAYNGLPEMAVTANGISVTVASENNEVTWATIAPDALSSNINVPVTIENAEYVEAGSGKNLKFKVGETELAVYNQWSLDVAALEAGKTYTLTGIGSIYVKGETTTYQLYLVSFAEQQSQQGSTWRDIKADLTSTSLIPEGAVQWDDVSTGIAVAEDGTLSRVAKDAENAEAVFNGKWHGTQYGWANFTASVKVEGCVKITLGQNNYGKEAIVKDADGNVVAKIDNMVAGKVWSANNPTELISVGYYRTNAPTTLTLEYGSYLGYFAVEAIDEADLPEEVTEYSVTFSKGEEAEGIAPAKITVEAGKAVTIPFNRTLWVDGKTLKAWTDGTAEYAPGTEITPSADVALTPVFAANTTSFADRTAEVTVTWDATQKTGGAPLIGFEGNTGFIVGQATVNGETIDMKLTIDATSGKFNNGNGEWIQVNNGTKFLLPACKGASYSIYTMGDSGENTFNGEKGTYASNYNTYTYEGTEETMEIVVGGGSWYKAISAIYPVPEVAPAVAGEPVWTSETAIEAAWYRENYEIVISPDKLANAKVGDKIHVAIDEVTALDPSAPWSAQVILKAGNWKDIEAALFIGRGDISDAQFVITGDILNFIKANGLIVGGQGYKTKLITIETTELTGSDKSVWVGDVTLNWTQASVDKLHFVNANNFEGVKAGDFVKFTYEAVGTPNIQLKYGWGSGEEYGSFYDQPTVELEVTEEAVAHLKEKGIIVNANGIRLTQIELISAADIVKGDANLDGEVTVSDAVLTVNIAAGVVTPTDDQKKAADIDGSGTVSVADAMAIVNIALEIEEEDEEVPTARQFITESNNSLTISDNSLLMQNTTAFTGFQMDVTLADGAVLNGVQLSERAQGMTMVYNKVGENTWRIVALSLDRTTITGNEGSLLTLDINGAQTFTVGNIEFSDANANAYVLALTNATGIASIENGQSLINNAYDLQGRKVTGNAKGLRIVNGKKVMVK